jgi:hypothetical protein
MNVIPIILGGVLRDVNELLAGLDGRSQRKE